MVNEMFKNGMRPVYPGEVLLEDFLKLLGMSANGTTARRIGTRCPFGKLRQGAASRTSRRGAVLTAGRGTFVAASTLFRRNAPYGRSKRLV
jgi:hypothetical protein